MQKETRATLTNDSVCTHREKYKQQGYALLKRQSPIRSVTEARNVYSYFSTMKEKTLN